MKPLVLLLFAVGAFAVPRHPRFDASTILPAQMMPGFWEGREFPEEFSKPSLTDRRIVGGVEAVPNSRPFQVALIFVQDQGASLCGGSILGSYAVLTAAHCPPNANYAQVVAGAHAYMDWEDTQQFQETDWWNFLSHENYNPSNLNNDIAIIYVDNSWEFNAWVQPTRLPTAQASELFVGETATVSGWGRTTNGGTSSDVLRVATVPVISNTQCAGTFGSSIVIASTLCVNTVHGQGSCQGDSGGPLTVPRAGSNIPIQIGVVSFGGSVCVGTYPSGFARVTSFLDWINYHY